MTTVEQDIDTIIESFKNGDDILIKGDGFRYHTSADELIKKFVFALSANQLSETANDIRNLDD